MGVSHLVASGTSFQYLLIKSLSSQETFIYRLPLGVRGLSHLCLLRDQHLLAALSSEGFFYLLDLSHALTGASITVKLTIRIPHEQIRAFDVDSQMRTLVLATGAGNVYVYDLAKAVENEHVLAKRRIEMGVEEELVVVKLQKANVKEVMASTRGEVETHKSSLVENEAR